MTFRKSILIAPIVLLGLSAAWVFARTQDSDRWLQVERRDLVLGVEVEGELKAVQSIELGPPSIRTLWNYKISFLIPEGTEVQPGQPVLGFDTTELKNQLQDETATRDSAQKELEKLETDLEIERRNLEMNLAETEARFKEAELNSSQVPEVTSRIELQKAKIDRDTEAQNLSFVRQNLEYLALRAEAELAALRSKRDRAAQRVEELEQQIHLMTVTAPRAGTAIYRTDHRGEKHKVGDSVWRMNKVIELPDLTRMVAEGEIDEAESGRVRIGQPVTFRLDAYLDQTYRGKVKSLRRTVQQKSRNNPKKIVKLEIELETTDVERMRPGMRLRGTIETERVEEALTVPTDAVFTDARGSSVFSRAWGQRKRIFPEFGRRNGEYFEILSGLSEGDRILSLESTGEEDA